MKKSLKDSLMELPVADSIYFSLWRMARGTLEPELYSKIDSELWFALAGPLNSHDIQLYAKIIL